MKRPDALSRDSPDDSRSGVNIRRHYPGAAPGRTASLIRPAVSAFPERVVGSCVYRKLDSAILVVKAAENGV